jgi:hypothetical protein
MHATIDVSPADDTEVDSADLMDAAAVPRCRHALGALCDLDDPVDLSRLADEVCSHDETGRRVAVALHRRHLPRLDDLSVVAYDADECSVELAVDGDAFETEGALAH